MSLEKVEQPMLDNVGSTTLGDVTLTNKAILDDLKRYNIGPRSAG